MAKGKKRGGPKGGGSGRDRGMSNEANTFYQKALKSIRASEEAWKAAGAMPGLMKNAYKGGKWASVINYAKAIIDMADAIAVEPKKPKPNPNDRLPPWRKEALVEIDQSAGSLGITRPAIEVVLKEMRLPNNDEGWNEAEKEAERRYRAEINNTLTEMAERKEARWGEVRRVSKTIQKVRYNERLDDAYDLRRRARRVCRYHRLSTDDTKLVDGLYGMHNRRGPKGHLLIEIGFVRDVEWAMGYLAQFSTKKSRIILDSRGRPAKFGPTFVDWNQLLEKRLEEVGAYSLRDVAGIIAPWLDLDKEKARIADGLEPSAAFKRAVKLSKQRSLERARFRQPSTGYSTHNMQKEIDEAARLRRADRTIYEVEKKKRERREKKEADITRKLVSGEFEGNIEPEEEVKPVESLMLGEVIGLYPQTIGRRSDFDDVVELQKRSKWMNE